jgi:hypothetical protein
MPAHTPRTGAVLPERGRIGALRAHWYAWALDAAPWPMRLLLGLVGIASLLAVVLVWASVMFGATPMTVAREALMPVRPGVDLSVCISNGDGAPSPPIALVGPGGALRLGRIPAHASRSVRLTDSRYGDIVLLDEVSRVRYTILPAQADLTGVTGGVRVDWKGAGGTVTSTCRVAPRRWVVEASSLPLAGISAGGQ